MRNNNHVTIRNTKQSRAPLAVLMAGLLVLVLALASVSGCARNDIGHDCQVDTDCALGLQCLKLPGYGNDPGICTIGCADTPCSSGHCIQSDQGLVCASECVDWRDCPESLSCQKAGSGRSVCWYPDSHLTPLPQGLNITRIEVVGDTNGDGVLNPGEDAKIRVYPANRSSQALYGLWAELVSIDQWAAVTACRVESISSWVNCSAACSCAGLSAAAPYTLAPDETAAKPILEISIKLAAETPAEPILLKVATHDELGQEWIQTLSIPVIAIGSSVMIASSKLTSDSNNDGFLSPGESGTVEIIARNPGTTHIEGLYAELLASDPSVTVTACHVAVGNGWVPCDSKCSCKAVTDAAKQALEPSEVGTDPILKITFSTLPETPLNPIRFDLAFYDALGLKWTGATETPVMAAESNVALSHVEILNDANGDGLVSPREPASIQVFAKNKGTSKAVGVWAELVAVDAIVKVEQCYVGVGPGWYPCDTQCSCKSSIGSGKQNLNPGETGTVGMLKIDFIPETDIAGDPLSFTVRFHDEVGNSWTENFSVPIKDISAEIRVATAPLVEEANGDGYLSPGETATLQVFPKNEGLSKAVAVGVALTNVTDSVDILTCHAMTLTEAIQCDSNCSCASIPEAYKPDLPGLTESVNPMMQIKFILQKEAIIAPVEFELTFFDAYGNVWTDTFKIAVTPIKANIRVDSTMVTKDTNEDGILSPGEKADVLIYAKNAGSTKTFGLWAELISDNPSVQITNCYAQVGNNWAKCNAACSCEKVSDSAKQWLEPNQIAEESMLRFTVQLSPEAALEPLGFGIKFHDMLGNEWEDTFYLDVEKHKADISVAFWEIHGDTNLDGKLTPGETASAFFYARNTGPVKAIGVYAALIANEPSVNVTGCYVMAVGQWSSCSASCSCGNQFEYAFQTIEAEKTSPTPILRVDFEFSESASYVPVDFALAFYDTLGVTWTDATSVDVEKADTELSVGFWEIQGDKCVHPDVCSDKTDGDGILNPGEKVSLNIYVKNEGTSMAVMTWPELTGKDAYAVIESCYVAGPGGLWGKCDDQCNCGQVFEELKSNVPAETTTNLVSLQINFTLDPTIPYFTIPFYINFHDYFQSVWNDGFVVGVVPP